MFFTRERVVCAYYFIGRPQHVQQDEQCWHPHPRVVAPR